MPISWPWRREPSARSTEGETSTRLPRDLARRVRTIARADFAADPGVAQLAASAKTAADDDMGILIVALAVLPIAASDHAVEAERLQTTESARRRTEELRREERQYKDGAWARTRERERLARRDQVARISRNRARQERMEVLPSALVGIPAVLAGLGLGNWVLSVLSEPYPSHLNDFWVQVGVFPFTHLFVAILLIVGGGWAILLSLGAVLGGAADVLGEGLRGGGSRAPEASGYEQSWTLIGRAKAEGRPVRGPVVEVVKGGLILDLGVRAFMPASLVELRRVHDLSVYLGRTLEARVLECDRDRGKAVLSRKALLLEAPQATPAVEQGASMDAIAKDQVVTGAVSSIVDFGAFVDLGGSEGLIHLSELSRQHVTHPSQVVVVGQTVSVKVLDVDAARGRVALSLKATEPEPWQDFARSHHVGQTVVGQVTRLASFGAFVRIGNGVEGLVHVSELAKEFVNSPEDVVQVGDVIMVKVLEINPERSRISLSVKQVERSQSRPTLAMEARTRAIGYPRRESWARQLLNSINEASDDDLGTFVVARAILAASQQELPRPRGTQS